MLKLGLQLVLKLGLRLTWKSRWGEARTSCASNSAKAFLKIYNAQDHDGFKDGDDGYNLDEVMEMETSASQPWN